MSIRIESAYIEITSCCNMRCKHCFNDSQLQRDDFMGREEFVKNISALVGFGCQSVILSGGEPLLHPDLAWMVQKALELGVADISIVSNGLIFRETLACLFHDLNVTLIISMDGPTEETYSIFREAKNFKKVKDNVRLYAGICNTEI